MLSPRPRRLNITCWQSEVLWFQAMVGRVLSCSWLLASLLQLSTDKQMKQQVYIFNEWRQCSWKVRRLKIAREQTTPTKPRVMETHASHFRPNRYPWGQVLDSWCVQWGISEKGLVFATHINIEKEKTQAVCAWEQPNEPSWLLRIPEERSVCRRKKRSVATLAFSCWGIASWLWPCWNWSVKQRHRLKHLPESGAVGMP